MSRWGVKSSEELLPKVREYLEIAREAGDDVGLLVEAFKEASGLLLGVPGNWQIGDNWSVARGAYNDALAEMSGKPSSSREGSELFYDNKSGRMMSVHYIN